MAEKEEKGLIGFDPLAWMNEESTQTDHSTMQKNNEDDMPIENEQKDDNVADPSIETVKEQNIDVADESKITLDARLNIQNVSDLYGRLLKILDNQNKIEIDASDVESIDTATLQLLIVFKQSAIQLHKEIIIDFPSDRFIEAAELLGLSEMLGVNQAAAGLF